MNTWKKHALLALSASLAFQLAGCSSDGGNAGSGAAGNNGNTAPAAGEDKSGVANTGFPIVKNKIELKAFSRQDPQLGNYNDMYLWKTMEEKTNIHLNWDTPSLANNASKERLNLLLSTGDLPDIILKNDLGVSQIQKFSSQGLFVPLEPYIDKYAPNVKAMLDKYPDVKQAITSPDGHIYFLPNVKDYLPSNVGRYPLINMKWLEKVGMQPPKTSDELLKVLIAFRDKDPNGNGKADEIPLSAHTIDFVTRTVANMFGLEYQYGYGNLFAANLENGKVNIWLDDDRYKETLQFLKQLYDQKLIDPEIFTQTDQIYFGKLADNRIGFTALYQPRNAGKYADQFDAIEPIKGPKGDQLWNFYNPRANSPAFLITKANKNIEASVRWADYFYSDEGATLIYLGKEGESYEKKPDGSLAFKPELLNSPNGLERELGQKWTYFPGDQAVGLFGEKQLRPTMEGTPMPTYIDKVKAYLPKVSYSAPMLPPEKQERANQITSDLETYVKEVRAKFILGTMTFDKWGEYTKQLEKIGLKELQAMYQAEYDKAKK
ncbi:extracellular solute-binding protein [Paenibacillus thalictri]|uniref:Extracellular solute-binding protein n=1 Tax=Paenibacillus thalictri TaxID=2527873 RepID=A0A4Q9E131_9BACL|nr:extracellular solute-binding protein [Paenibacillus thalictri]TBL81968.1 extracellular solute-binding protein [Paenibacillus thalictri]